MADSSNASDTLTQNSDASTKPAKVISKEDKKDDRTVSFIELFRYASPMDKLFIFFGTVSAVASGAAMPLMTVLYANAIRAFLNFSISESREEDKTETASELRKTIGNTAILFVALSAGVFVLSSLQMVFWMVAGENQAKRLRQIYYEAILRQDIAYFDQISTGDITNRITSDTDIFQEGISEKVGLIIRYSTTIISGFIIAFTKGWILSLVLCCAFPLLAGASIVMAKLLAKSAKKGQDAYGEAGAAAEQVLSGIRTVVAFGGQQRGINRYTEKLQKAYLIGKKKALITGSATGFILAILFLTYSLTFWYGSILTVQGKSSGGDIMNVFFAMLMSAYAVGSAAPNFTSISNARGAASNLFSVIDRIPPINSSSPYGKKLIKSAVKGRLEFRNIKFHYPARPDIPILKNFSLIIEPGETVALVGTSGSGKSTIISLLERFYDPIEGQILLDGEDIKNINIKSLRSQIGLVGQEPVLFPKSVRQNVAWGVDADMSEPSLEKVIEVCKKSNAHDFISELPQKYDTDVGEKGSLMSGGQKQR